MRDSEKTRLVKRLPAVALGAVALLAVLYSVFGGVGIVNTVKMYRTEGRLEAENARLREEIAQLREEVENLRSNPSYIEGIARRELGLIGEKENVIVLERKKDADPHPPAGRAGGP
jgi:cell division protein FtsB